MMVPNNYFLENDKSINSPALIVYKDIVIQNIDLCLSKVFSTAHLRPHIKTFKMSAIIQLLIQKGVFQFKCATIAETELLGEQKAKDVLLAIQPVNHTQYQFLKIIKKHKDTQFSCLIDDVSCAENLNSLAKKEGITVSIWIDVNIGMNRTGVKPEKLAELIHHIKSLSNLSIIGIHAYDGHIKGNLEERTKELETIFPPLYKEIESIEKNILNTKLKFISGGSPSFFYHRKNNNTQSSPGTFVLWDIGYEEKVPEDPFGIAALVLGNVISVIDETHVCINVGHKAMAAENPVEKRMKILNIPEAVLVSHSEEHAVLKVQNSDRYPVGTVVYVMPMHICPTVALYDEALVAEQGKIVDQWKIEARKRNV